MGRAALLSANPLARYLHWLHGRWPAGTVEPLPRLAPDGATGVSGLYVAGDLTGIPLLKFAADGGARVVRTILADPGFEALRREREPGVRDLVIAGAGVSGMSAALEAQRAGLDFAIYESRRPFHTVADFPRAKPIFTYPMEWQPESALRLTAEVKETLLDDLQSAARGIAITPGRVEAAQRKGGVLEVRLEGGATVRALRVILAVGRSGDFRKLGVPGEDLDKVYNRLHDPKDFAGRHALVVGGGDSAIETALALAQAGSKVTLCHRGTSFARAKPENVAALEAFVRPSTARTSFRKL